MLQKRTNRTRVITGDLLSTAVSPFRPLSVSQNLHSVRRNGATPSVTAGFGTAFVPTVASAEGHDQTVQQLLKKGADVNASGGIYSNALQAASYSGRVQIVLRPGPVKAGNDRSDRSEPF